MLARYQNARFMLGARFARQFPPDEGAEVALAGRSNAGKSSALNALTHQRAARVSKTPGRTQEINFFALDDERRLADLPGYGYAQVPENLRRQWQALMQRYMQTRQSLRGMVIVMDVRHPLTEHDLRMIEVCSRRRLPVHILLTKADKLSRGAAKDTLLKVERELRANEGLTFSAQLFSAPQRLGVDEARAVLDAWLA